MTTSSSSALITSYSGWTEEELEETLYQSDKQNTSPILEFKYVKPTTTTTTVASSISSTTAVEPTVSPTKRQSAPASTSNLEGNERYEKEENEESDSEEGEDTPFETAYIDIPIEFDDVHIIKFYAEWCPHCQHYKPIYVKMAREISKRSINVNVFFHAVSCTLNDDTCATYDIDGYPTFFGYRGGGRTAELRPDNNVNSGEQLEEREKIDDHDNNPFADLVGNTTLKGTILDLNGNLNHDIDLIASTMKIDLASVARDYSKSESKYSNSQDQRNFEEWKRQRGHEVAKEKVALLETHVSLNQLYHDSLLSLTFILQNGVYYQSHQSVKMRKQSEISALHDFLKLAHWSTPQSWHMQKTYITDLVRNFDSEVIQGKGRLHKFIQKYTNEKAVSDKKFHDTLPWGYIDAEEVHTHGMLKRRHATNGLGQDPPSQTHYHHDETDHRHYVPVDQNKWTKTCSHGPSSSGFTCGLWELFHIMTIGATMTNNQMFGYKNGYLISSRDVGETIRNFVANFFRCDVCRTNFVTMYDNCGHNHCTRLSPELPLLVSSKKKSESNSVYNGDQIEIALWLWEVHNAVNVRLMKESAVRDRRNFTVAEAIAAKFPSRNTCPLCWLDDNMTEWDSFEVYKFLKDRYWPPSEDLGGGNGLPSLSSSSLSYGRTSKLNGLRKAENSNLNENGSNNDNVALVGKPISNFGLFLTVTPFIVITCMFLRRYLLDRGVTSSAFLRRKSRLCIDKNKFF